MRQTSNGFRASWIYQKTQTVKVNISGFLYTCIFGRANIVKYYSEVKINTVGLKNIAEI